MRKLYTIPGCEPCKELKDWIKEQENPVYIDEIIELKKLDGEWHEKTEDGFVKVDKNVHSFPALFVDDEKKQSVFIVGMEGIQSLLLKSYIYETKHCPHLDGPCIEKECGKFVIMTKGPIQEGGCSDYWTPILLTEMLTKGK